MRGLLRRFAFPLLTVPLVLLQMGCASSPPQATAPATAPSNNEESARETVVGVAHHIDAKNWVELRRLFAERVVTDYTSLFGGAPREQSGDELIAAWRGVLANVATQHLLGPVVVDVQGGSASAACHVRGLHQAPGAPSGELWEVLGHYRFELGRSGERWTISKMTLLTQAQTGNTKLLAEASSLSPAPR